MWVYQIKKIPEFASMTKSQLVIEIPMLCVMILTLFLFFLFRKDLKHLKYGLISISAVLVLAFMASASHRKGTDLEIVEMGREVALR